ncbi:zinc ABC transporter substrate-binding protein [Oceanospirillum sp.]|uniref:zinc ABC transporter substrate-binding protein n=1 Tax=Oceanospirillum sp. TaxID=2021254 RepID=UPI003A930E1F
MPRSSFIAGFFLSLISFSSWASTPKVVVDIAPLHSLVSQVMKGVEQPKLLIQPEASPHRYSLRPSEAKALSEADVVFWISEDLTPWLESSLQNLAPSAHKVEMLELTETVRHGFRQGATFEAHSHHDDDGDEDHHSDGVHDEHHDEEAHHEHHHGQYDPHTWLDPVNAKVWAKDIAQNLSEVDPEHAALYQRNAAELVTSLDQLIVSMNKRAEQLKGIRFIVFHDAYQYLERRFGLMAAGAISLSDASDPSPARIREIQNRVAEWGVRCAFTEPQYNPRMVSTVFEGSTVETIGVMDPLGADINDPTEHYFKLLTRLMTALEQCQSK